jgi:hypothetical protein
MSDAIQIFPLNEVSERANMAGDRAQFINIYNGHIKESGQRGVLTMTIRRNADGSWPDKQLQYVGKLRGNFTAVIMPTKEYFYISSTGGHSMNGTGEINFFSPFDDAPGNHDLQQLVQQLIQVNQDNENLRRENESLRQDLAALESGADRFSYALEKLFFKIAPAIGIMPANHTTQPMNGQPGQAPGIAEIDVSGNDERAVENAIAILLISFGEQNILKFARRIQQNPNLVNTLIPML